MYKVTAKSTESIKEIDAKQIPHENGWVTGWYVGGMVVGDVITTNGNEVAFEWITPVKE